MEVAPGPKKKLVKIRNQFVVAAVALAAAVPAAAVEVAAAATVTAVAVRRTVVPSLRTSEPSEWNLETPYQSPACHPVASADAEEGS